MEIVRLLKAGQTAPSKALLVLSLSFFAGGCATLIIAKETAQLTLALLAALLWGLGFTITSLIGIYRTRPARTAAAASNA